MTTDLRSRDLCCAGQRCRRRWIVGSTSSGVLYAGVERFNRKVHRIAREECLGPKLHCPNVCVGRHEVRIHKKAKERSDVKIEGREVGVGKPRVDFLPIAVRSVVQSAGGHVRQGIVQCCVDGTYKLTPSTAVMMGGSFGVSLPIGCAASPNCATQTMNSYFCFAGVRDLSSFASPKTSSTTFAWTSFDASAPSLGCSVGSREAPGMREVGEKDHEAETRSECKEPSFIGNESDSNSIWGYALTAGGSDVHCHMLYHE